MANTQASDETLMLAYCDGDAAAFEALYRRYRGALYRYFLRQCRHPATAEELFQDVWMKLVRARKAYEPRARFSTYLFHMAHNHLIDYYRRQSGRAPLSYGAELDPEAIATSDCDGPERGASNREQMSRLMQSIDALPEAQREAFLLREEGGLSLEEIAQVTEVNMETAKSRLRYAVNKLRKAMRDEVG